MKKIILFILPIFFVSCTIDEEICNCTGVFSLYETDLITEWETEVEYYCKSGELVDPTWETGTGTRPALFFKGCRPK